MSKSIVKISTSAGEVTLSPSTIRQYLVHGNGNITDQEAMMFMALCKAQRLNPYLREAYLIKYGTMPASMVVGKEAFLKRARSIPDCLGYKAGVICWCTERAQELRTEGYCPPACDLVGGWGEVYIRGWDFPLRIEVSLAEYIGKRKDGSPNRMWQEKPATMIRKVALVQALREAFPDALAGMYSQEEISTETLPTNPVNYVSPKASAVEMPIDDSPPEDVIEPPTSPTDPPLRDVTPAPESQQEQPAKAPAPAQSKKAPAPKQEKPPRRRRATRWEVDKDVFGAAELNTCGATPEQLLAIRRFCKHDKDLKERVLVELERVTGYQEMSYLRQDEADDIITLCLAKTRPAPADMPDDLVDCPDSEGDRRSIAQYCTAGKCATRNEAGWCPAIDDAPASVPPEGPEEAQDEPQWSAYQQALLAHDWNYARSDDQEIYDRGIVSWSKIQAMHKKLSKVDKVRADDMLAKHGRE